MGTAFEIFFLGVVAIAAIWLVVHLRRRRGQLAALRVAVRSQDAQYEGGLGGASADPADRVAGQPGTATSSGVSDRVDPRER
jgi:hypothetical protein